MVVRRVLGRFGSSRRASRALALAAVALVSSAFGLPYLRDHWTFLRQRALGTDVAIPAAEGLALESAFGCAEFCSRLLLTRAVSYVELVPSRHDGGGGARRFRLVADHQGCAAARAAFEENDPYPGDKPTLQLGVGAFEGALAYDQCLSVESIDQPTAPLFLRGGPIPDEDLNALYASQATGHRAELFEGVDPATRRLLARSDSHFVDIPIVPFVFTLPVHHAMDGPLATIRRGFNGPNLEAKLIAMGKAEPARPVEALLGNLSEGPRMRDWAALLLGRRLRSAPTLDPAWAEPIIKAVNAEPALLRSLYDVLTAYGPAARDAAPAVMATMAGDADPAMRGAAIQVALAADLIERKDVSIFLAGANSSNPFENRMARQALERLGVAVPP
ncbi:MAG: hypothetical protein HQL41_08875 [Alphaproteobacteria bacterium]|nr:hypothetical protein [Alphaproteobacteria bacterium]